MDLTFTAEQRALGDAVRDLFSDTHPAHRVAALADDPVGWDPSTWSQLAAMGLLGVSAPERWGGSGAGLVEEAILFEQAGAALYPGPLFSTVALALPALQHAPFADEVVPQVTSGQRTVAFAWSDAGRPTPLARAATATLPARLDPQTGIARLTGVKEWVADGDRVTSLIVAARTEQGTGLFLVDLPADGVTITPMNTIDGTRRMSRIEFVSVPGRSIVDPASSWPVFGAVWRRALILASAEAVGAISRLLDVSSAYASTREQFGRPIGTYQAISHKIADLYMTAELGRSLYLWAALEGDASTTSVDVAAAGAASFVLPAAVTAAEVAIQVHGGIGMTWESILHRYLKRALQMNVLDSPPELQRHQIAKLLLDR